MGIIDKYGTVWSVKTSFQREFIPVKYKQKADDTSIYKLPIYKYKFAFFACSFVTCVVITI